MNDEVIDFLYKIKFPFTVGYGMTECGPLISYDHHYEYVPGSCGQILKGIMKVRIDSEDPYNKVGEIQVSGENVIMSLQMMVGYVPVTWEQSIRIIISLFVVAVRQ